MEIPCVFKVKVFLDNKKVYICEFSKQNIPEDVQILPKGLHKLGFDGSMKKNVDVFGVLFNKCILTKVPQGFTTIFPNMRILSIWESNLKVVTKNDFAEYRNIERIGFCDNKIEFLPGDLFEGFHKLEEVSFNGNKLKLIEPWIIDGQTKLKMVNFEENPAYTKCFSDFSNWESNATLQEVKDELFLRFYKDHKNIKDLLKLEEENQALKESNKLLRDENCGLQSKDKGMETEIKNFLRDDETFKDFHIQINDQRFPVHKILLAARSPTIADILRNNPEVENLNLSDIPVEVFEIILHFIYTDEFPPDEGTSFSILYATAGKLKIERLKDYAAKKIITKIESFNGLNILKLSKMYKHDGLRLTALKKIKADYPKIDFKDEWAEDVDTMIKIIEAYKMKEEAIRKAEEEFNNLIKKC